MASTTPPNAEHVCVGLITSPHGVRGLVKVKPFTEDPASITAYGPVTDETGRRSFKLQLLSQQKSQWIVRIEGVDDRNAAEELKGVRLYVPRSALPPPDDDEFYYLDLVGLSAEDTDGRAIGTVKGVFDFGAGDVIEIAGLNDRPIMVPFTRAAVPVVDVPAKRLVIDAEHLVEVSEQRADEPSETAP